MSVTQQIDLWSRDLRYASRALLQSRGFSAAVILTLALGIGAATAVYCAMDRLLLRALPYDKPQQLIALHETQTGKGFRPVSLTNFSDWRAQSTSYDEMAGFMTRTFGLRGGRGDEGTPVSVINTGMVTSGLLRVLHSEPTQGRSFTEQEELRDAHVMVVSDALWAAQFNRSPGIVGRKVQLNEMPYEIIGVLSPDFVFPDPATRTDALIPINHHDYNGRSVRPLQVVARLKDNAGLSTAQAEIMTIGERLAKAFPEENANGGAALETLDEAWKGSRRRPLLLMTIAALLLLGIVATNVVNLLLGRAIARSRELSIRLSLGATWPAILRSSLSEALLLVAAGTVAALALAHWSLQGLPYVFKLAGISKPANAVSIDVQAIIFAAGLCAALTLLCGLIPALLARPGRHRDSPKLRQSLVIAQVCLSLVLLLSATAFIRVFAKLVNQYPGFDSSQVYYFGFGLPDARYDDLKSIAFNDRLRRKLEEIPGVDSAAAVWNLPLNGRTQSRAFQFEGAGQPQSRWTWVNWNLIDPAYFRTVRIPLLKGRSLSSESDTVNHPLAVVVNQTFDKMFGGGRSVLGRRIEVNFHTDVIPQNRPWEIVGVVADTYQRALDAPVRPQIYFSVNQCGLDGGHYVLRTPRHDPRLSADVAAAVRSIDPGLERINLRKLDDWVSVSLGDRRLPAVLTSLFGAMGLLLTALGIYATVALDLARRRREIAVRMALGATREHIGRLVFSTGLTLTAGGVALGIVLYLATAPLLESQLYQVAPADPLNTVTAVALVILCTIVACIRPLWDALRVHPATALREN